MNKLALACAVVLAACGGTSSPGATQPVEPSGTTVTMTCDGMANNLAARQEAEGEYSGSQISQTRGIVVDECSTMKWSQGAINCMAAAVGADEIERCKAEMTPAQQQSLSAATGW